MAHRGKQQKHGLDGVASMMCIDIRIIDDVPCDDDDDDDDDNDCTAIHILLSTYRFVEMFRFYHHIWQK